MVETQTPPQPIAYDGQLTAPARCVVCREPETDLHQLVWAPHLPPARDGYQRGVHHRCFTRLTEHVIKAPAAVVRAVEEATDGKQI